MDMQDLLRFIQRIAECNDSYKIEISMLQLAEIMERSQVDPKLVDMVKQMSGYKPELLEIAKQQVLRPDDLSIAIRRAKQRIENERSNYGRC